MSSRNKSSRSTSFMGADAFSTSTCPTAGSIPRRTHYSMRTTYNDREGRAEVRTKATTKEELKAERHRRYLHSSSRAMSSDRYHDSYDAYHKHTGNKDRESRHHKTSSREHTGNNNNTKTRNPSNRSSVKNSKDHRDHHQRDHHRPPVSSSGYFSRDRAISNNQHDNSRNHLYGRQNSDLGPRDLNSRRLQRHQSFPANMSANHSPRSHSPTRNSTKNQPAPTGPIISGKTNALGVSVEKLNVKDEINMDRVAKNRERFLEIEQAHKEQKTNVIKPTRVINNKFFLPKDDVDDDINYDSRNATLLLLKMKKKEKEDETKNLRPTEVLRENRDTYCPRKNPQPYVQKSKDYLHDDTKLEPSEMWASQKNPAEDDKREKNKVHTLAQQIDKVAMNNFSNKNNTEDHYISDGSSINRDTNSIQSSRSKNSNSHSNENSNNNNNNNNLIHSFQPATSIVSTTNKGANETDCSNLLTSSN